MRTIIATLWPHLRRHRKLGLIAMAFVLALIYGWLCRETSPDRRPT